MNLPPNIFGTLSIAQNAIRRVLKAEKSGVLFKNWHSIFVSANYLQFVINGLEYSCKD